MNKKYFIGIIALSGIIFLAIFFSLKEESVDSYSISANNSSAESNMLEESSKKSCCSDEGINKYSEKSIYNLESKWTNQNGMEIELGNYKGKNIILTMFYSSCTYACPIIINDMKKIELAVQKKKMSGVRFVMVSIDPERDTLEKLKETALKNNLDETTWALLNGSKEDVMNVAAAIGFKFKEDGKGGFSHSNLITILNKSGEIEYQHVGLNQNMDDVLYRLDQLY